MTVLLKTLHNERNMTNLQILLCLSDLQPTACEILGKNNENLR